MLKISRNVFFDFCMILLFIFVGCSEQAKQENTQLREKIEELEAKVEQLESEKSILQTELNDIKQTDNYYYQMAINSRKSQNYEESNNYLFEMLERFPQSQFKREAKALITENKEKQQQVQKSRNESLMAQRQAEARKNCDLELISWNWSKEHGYAQAEGQVKNISGEAIENVEAVVSFYDANSNFIKAGSALIEYDPILSGQTSPFRVMTTENPAMKKATIEFKSLFGGTIQTYSSK